MFLAIIIISLVIGLAVGFGLGFFTCRNMGNTAKEQVEKTINKVKNKD